MSHESIELFSCFKKTFNIFTVRYVCFNNFQLSVCFLRFFWCTVNFFCARSVNNLMFLHSIMLNGKTWLTPHFFIFINSRKIFYLRTIKYRKKCVLAYARCVKKMKSTKSERYVWENLRDIKVGAKLLVDVSPAFTH